MKNQCAVIWKWIAVVMTLVALGNSVFAVLNYLRWKDQEVLLCHLTLNDVNRLAAGDVQAMWTGKDKLLNHYYKQFNGALSHHPGRDYFLSQIGAYVELEKVGIRERDSISVPDLELLLAITNEPSSDRTYYLR